jgi:outer membrane protein OmpA-like peptidoglycan-associated protein
LISLYFNRSKLLCRGAGALALLLVAGCQSSDYSAKEIATSFKGQVDWVRDAFGQPIAKLSNDNAAQPYPDAPSDARPLARSEKQRKEMMTGLDADQATAGKIQAQLAKSDPTRYLFLDGAKPTAQPIALATESVELPVGVRDVDSYDPSRAGDWFELGSVEFSEGSAQLPDEDEEGLRRAALLVQKEGTLRVLGYSASDRLSMEGKGPHEANRFLANLRARRVAEQLVAFGAPANQLLVGPAPEAVRGTGNKVEIIIDY